MKPEHWTARLHAVSSTVAWCCGLNALWLGFTLLGGVVLGIGPATVAACILVRRRMLGETIHFVDFARIWRREFFRGTVVVLPVVVLVVALWSNYAFFTALGPGPTPARLVTLLACAVAIAIGSYVAPLYAHYHLPLLTYLYHASRVALARPASTVLLLAVFLTIAFASAVFPVLLLFVSAGVWLQTSTWLCVRFFEENDRRLAQASSSGHPSTGPAPAPLALPVQPVRIR